MKIRDCILIAALLAVAAACFWLFGRRGGSPDSDPLAQIIIDGRVVERISLRAAPNQVFEPADGLRFEVNDRRIRFFDATCPDKICQNAGFISRPGQVAVCVPRKAVLKIVDAHES